MTPLVAAVLTAVLNVAPVGHAQPASDPAGDVLSGHMEASTNPRHPEPRVALGDATDVDVRVGTDPLGSAVVPGGGRGEETQCCVLGVGEVAQLPAHASEQERALDESEGSRGRRRAGVFGPSFLA